MQFKYSYPNLERVEENDMRFYKDSNNDLVPSVTTVLDATGDKSGITQWRRKVGPYFSSPLCNARFITSSI